MELLKPVPVCSIEDEAIDAEAMSLPEYARTHDPSMVRIKQGHRPTVFLVGPLTVGYLSDVIGSARGELKAINALIAAVHRVEMPNGDVLQPDKVEKGAYSQKIASDAWLELLRGKVGYRALVEIGFVAIDLANLPESKRGPFASVAGLGVTA